MLTADAALDLRANPDQDAQGLVDRGAPRPRPRPGGDRARAARHAARSATRSSPVRPTAGSARCSTSTATTIEEADPSRPVMVLGLTAVPGAGDNFMVVADDRVARQIAEKREARERAAMLAKRPVRRTSRTSCPRMEKGESRGALLILKGDVSGSVEALEDALAKIDVGDDVRLRVIDRGVGAITETNVKLAAASDADHHRLQRPPAGQGDRGRRPRGRRHPLLLGDLPGDRRDRGRAQGHAQAGVRGGAARARPRSARCSARPRSATSPAAWSRSGVIRRNAKARLLRDGAVVADNLDMSSLRREKDDATEVREGFECGLTLGGYNDIKIGDVIETFEMREIPRG